MRETLAEITMHDIGTIALFLSTNFPPVKNQIISFGRAPFVFPVGEQLTQAYGRFMDATGYSCQGNKRIPCAVT